MTITPIRDVPHLRMLGRHAKREGALALTWTASGFEARIACSTLSVEVEGTFRDHAPWCGFSVDGSAAGRQMVCGRQWIDIVRHVSPDIPRTVAFYLETQPNASDPDAVVLVHALRFDGRTLPLDEKKRKIEFVGDSLTTGEGAIGPSACEEWLPMWMSARSSYPRYTADLLSAEYRVLSQSGYGVLWDWEHDASRTMPALYDKVCGALCSEQARARGMQDDNDFAAWQPDVIVVNLGTNDNGGIMNKTPKHKRAKERAQVGEAAAAFLAHLRQKNPNAEIFWAYGMCGKALKKTLQKAVADSGDGRAHYIDLPQARADEQGARWHPAASFHKRCALMLAREIERFL